ncbi:RND family transporter [Moritella sp. F3]|uniref:efflux RND transporter permease subunit n=1 Tax=Moritella sp. F3 TaxID=2718882 RepID=UPI0018E0EA0A|nr:efflux RND transporter permease subunit [Moritella sp. F3]GIC78654.1 RND transporter [Moritella sp. F1]GIC79807.1 RND transporter [Moritella sp. F3]
MKQQMDVNNDKFSRYAEWVVKWRWLLIVTSVMSVLAFSTGSRLLAFNNDYRIFFSPDNPQLIEYEQLQRTYTQIDNILFAVVPENGDVFSTEALAALEELTNQTWQLPYTLRVDSPTNFQHTTSENDDLWVRDLVSDATDMSEKQRQSARDVALAEPFLNGQLINPSTSIAGVNVTFQLPQKSLDEIPQLVEKARLLVQDIESKYKVKIHLAGMIMLSNSFFEAATLDMSTLVPAMYLIILFVALLLLRSFTATLGTLVVIMFSIMSGMGIAGYMGVQLTPPALASMTIIMTLSVADSIHILSTIIASMRKGVDKLTAIKNSIRINASPVILTSVTTAIGFLSMNFSESPPFHDLGNITAVGVMAAMLLSLTLLPAMMLVLPLRIKKVETQSNKKMERLGSWVIHKQKPILIASTLVSVLLLSFIPKNTLNDNFVDYFDESMVFRQASEIIDEKFTGVYQIQYSLDSGQTNGVSQPEFLNKVSDFTDWLREQPEVRHVNTITDTFKRLNMNLHGDDKSFYRLPEDAESAAQYLLLYELSLPYGLDLNNQLNVSKSSTQVIVTVSNMPSGDLVDIAERGTDWLQVNANIRAIGVGPAVMFSHISERNIDSMIGGTLIAVIIISLLIGIALRSVKLGIVSLIPNLLPAGLAFGLWGLFVGEVNLAVAMVTGMVLGIVVDDTIHFLSKYQRARTEKLLAPEAAVLYAFSTVGTAIVVTSFILIAGFSVLAQSSFGMNSNMAILTAIAIAIAMIADFLLLPVLLLKMEARSKDHKDENMPSKHLKAADKSKVNKHTHKLASE